MIIRNTASRQFGRHAFFSLLAAFIFAAAAQAAGDLTVQEFAGPVKLKMDSRWQDPRVGKSVQLPATVSTGDHGSIKLAQDGSVISVAANTAIEIFANPDSGRLVRRVVQSQGSAFYDISNREHKKLRVETPYLAAVIKGTQFNVTVEPERSSIALYEGLLRIEAPDIGEAVDLRAGFIARRRAGDATITVIPMDGGEAASGQRSGVGDDGGQVTADGSTRNVGGDIAGDDGLLPTQIDLDAVDTPLGTDSNFGSTKEPLILEATGDGDLGTGEIGVDLGADASVGDIDAGLDAGVDADLGTGEIGGDLTTDAEVAGIDTGLDAGVDADLDSGQVGVDASLGDTELDAELDLGTLEETTAELGDALLGGEETGTEDTTQEEEETTPLLDPGNLLGL